ncbi:BT_3928 family protein [uncultured Croceitalea sp.]|uniref:BT_3928 family protein n=1 Tax=uncultured Croceitalea sp. TaxID=1798908 RepID=UPI0033069196
MKYLVGFSRVVVSVLFIISGLIKLNDPVGFSFKLEEYFSQGVLDLPAFTPYALAIAIIVVIIEVLLGVLLLIGYKPKFTVWSLLIMIVFFTFLTFYSAYFNKVTDCGCFGDAVKLTPWESFTKDIILLVLILVLVLGVKHIKSLFNNFRGTIVIVISLIVCVVFCNHVLNHLPTKDFRPYKIGANIEEGMSVPDNAPKALYEYAWRFKVNGEDKVIITNGDYPTVDGEFIDVETTEVQKGYEPPIHDFTIEKDGEDFTASFLGEEKLVMVIAYDLAKSKYEVFKEVKTVTDEALSKGYKVIGMSASGTDRANELVEEYGLNFEFYFTDETTLKTIVRSNPAILVLESGTIVQKAHYNDLQDLKLKDPKNGIYFNLELKKSLDSVMALDQKYRSDWTPENWSKQIKIDSSNLNYVEKIITDNGYPGKSLVGEKAGVAAWYVIQHSNKIDEYLAIMKQAAEAGELPFMLYAMMLDRYLTNQNKPQIYGTQSSSWYINSPKEITFMWPLKNKDSVNIWREEAGFSQSFEESAKDMYGEDFEIKYYTIKEINKLVPELAK